MKEHRRLYGFTDFRGKPARKGEEWAWNRESSYRRVKGLNEKVTARANGRRNALGQNGPEWP